MVTKKRERGFWRYTFNYAEGSATPAIAEAQRENLIALGCGLSNRSTLELDNPKVGAAVCRHSQSTY